MHKHKINLIPEKPKTFLIRGFWPVLQHFGLFGCISNYYVFVTDWVFVPKPWFIPVGAQFGVLCYIEVENPICFTIVG